MEALKETVKVKTIDGIEREVQIYKLISFRKKQQIISKLFSGMKIKAGQDVKDIDIDAADAMNIFGDLADALWADKNVKLDDVDGDSLYPVLTGRFNTFLGELGFKAQVSDNKGGGSGTDERSNSKPTSPALPTDPDRSDS